MKLAATIRLLLTGTAAAAPRLRAGGDLCASMGCAGGCLLEEGCRRPPSRFDGDEDCAAAGGIPCGLDETADEPTDEVTAEPEPADEPEEKPKEKAADTNENAETTKKPAKKPQPKPTDETADEPEDKLEDALEGQENGEEPTVAQFLFQVKICQLSCQKMLEEDPSILDVVVDSDSGLLTSRHLPSGVFYLKQPDHGAYLGMCGHETWCQGSNYGVKGYSNKPSRTKWQVEEWQVEERDCIWDWMTSSCLKMATFYLKQPDHDVYLGMCGDETGCGGSKYGVMGFSGKPSRTKWLGMFQDNYWYFKNDDYDAYLGMCGHETDCDGSKYGLMGFPGKPSRTRWVVEEAGAIEQVQGDQDEGQDNGEEPEDEEEKTITNMDPGILDAVVD